MPNQFGSRQLTALSMYDGTLYSTELKQQIVSNLGLKFSVLIMSGGYGLLRPDETITEYDVNIKETTNVWLTCLPAVLQGYVAARGIREVHGIFSTSGAYLHIGRECKRLCRPTTFRLYSLGYHGPAAQQRVPQLQSELFLRLSKGELPASVDGVSIRIE